MREAEPPHRASTTAPMVKVVIGSGSVEVHGKPSAVARFILQLVAGGVTIPGMHTDAPNAAPAVSVRTEATAPTIDEALARWRDEAFGENITPSTVKNYAWHVGAIAAFNQWTRVDQVTLMGVNAFIASRARGEHGGKPWGTSIRRQAGTAMATLMDFCRRAKLVEADPISDLRQPKRHDGPGKHSFTADEARALISASISRHLRDPRRYGFAPLVWYFMFSTGLRHEELNHILWSDVTIEGEFPGLRCRSWPGNKAKRADWLPFRPTLCALLQMHAATVAHGPHNHVFPVVPTKETFEKDRKGANLPRVDQDGGIYTPHATRASFITWLGQCPGTPEGLRQRLARHKSLTESVYTQRTRLEMAEAIAQLPEIWPVGETWPPTEPLSDPDRPSIKPGVTPLNGEIVRDISRSRLAKSIDVRYLPSSEPPTHDPHPKQSSQPAPVGGSHPQWGGSDDSGGPSVELLTQPDGMNPQAPVLGFMPDSEVLAELVLISKTLRQYLNRR